MSQVESFRRDEMTQAETLTMACIVGTRGFEEAVVARLFLENDPSLDMVRVSVDAYQRSRKQSNGSR